MTTAEEIRKQKEELEKTSLFPVTVFYEETMPTYDRDIEIITSDLSAEDTIQGEKTIANCQVDRYLLDWEGNKVVERHVFVTKENEVKILELVIKETQEKREDEKGFADKKTYLFNRIRESTY